MISILRQKFRNVPHVICDARLHCRGNANRAVNAAKVVIGEVQAESAVQWFSHFFEKAFVKRVSLRICIRIVSF
jgi:hypothetical protein